MTVRMDTARIDLRAAKLCMELDCNTIFNTAVHRHCPTCGSLESYPLEAWLNRERDPSVSHTGLGAMGADTTSRLSSPPRVPWPARLREKRADSGTPLVAGPLKLRARIPRRRLG